MRKLISLLLVVLMVLFIAGCAKPVDLEKSGIEQRTAANQQAANAAASAKAELEAKYAALDSQIKADSDATKSKLLAGKDKVVFASTFERASYGKMVAVVVGVRNDAGYKTNFKIFPSFKKAYDTTNNPITVDPKSMALWIDTKTDFLIEDVDVGKAATTAIYFNIKEIKEGVAPVKGTYVFNFEVKEGLGEYQSNEYGKSDISVLVQ